MKKNDWFKGKSMSFLRWKTFLIMKLLMVFILGSLMQSYAVVSNAQNKRLTLRFENSTLKEVLQKLEDETEFSFIYKDELVNSASRVTENFKDEKVTDLLTKVLKNENMTYIINGRVIVIMPNDSGLPVGQQQKSVSGKVTDSSGASLPGVSVVVKGTTTGVITDLEGKYSLGNIPENATLQFSFVGMKSQEVAVGSKTTINVSLAEETIGIEEVVAIGYGTQKKRDVAGAVETVKSSDLETSITSNFAQTLQGKVSGVQLIQSTGQPGANVSLQIRSNPSFANGGVLYVLDGVPVNDNAGIPSSAKYGTTGVDQSPLNFINPNDIESISFLKDASSASIYGARAGAGVVLITTKKGKSGKPRIQYDVSYANQKVDKMYDVLDTKDYMVQRNLIGQEVWMKNNKVAPYYGNVDANTLKPYVPFYTQSAIDQAISQPSAVDAILRSGFTHQHNLSIAGGNEKTTYAVSGNYFDQKAIIIGSGYTRYNGKLSLDQIISDKLKFGASVIVSNSKTDNVVTGGRNENGGILTAAIYYPATLPLQNPDGSYPLNPLWSNTPNPLSFATVTDKTNSQRVLTSGYAEWKIIDGLTARGNLSYDQSTNKRSSFYPTTFSYGKQANGLASINENASNTELMEYTLNYKKNIGKKSVLTALAGYSYQLSHWDGFGAGNQNFISNSLSYYNLASGQAISPSVSSYSSQETWASYFGRATYQYNNKYILQASLRRDGSSKFAKNKKWGYFPSFSASWVASDENFMKNISVISNLKLRAGFGETGNSGFPGTAFEKYGIGASPLFGQNSVSSGIFLTQAGNPELTWETAAETNIGIDFGILNNRITGSLDAFNKTIRNLISFMPFPSDFIVSGVYGNAGKTKSTGYEISIQSKNIVSNKDGGLTWSTSFTFSHYLNYWVERSAQSLATLPKYITATGKKALFNGYYGYETNGLFSGNYGTAPATMPNMLPGGIIVNDIHGYDINGNLTEPDGKITAADQTLLANMDPKYNFGLGNTFTFKNFDLTIFLSGIVRNGIDPYSPSGIYRMSLVQDNLLSFGWNESNSIKERWTFQNPNGIRPTGISDGSYATYQNNSNYWIIDASFIRCKNITLGYTIPGTWLKSNLISSCKMFVDVQNAFTITKYPGLDPEQSQNNYYPYSKSVVFGLSVGF